EGMEYKQKYSVVEFKGLKIVARVKMVKPERVDDPVVREIFDWVTQMEGSVPNHFHVEMNFPEFFKSKLGATKVLWQMGELSMDEIQHVRFDVLYAIGITYSKSVC